MKKLTAKKLGLSKEIVRALAAQDLADVVGGYNHSAAAVTCHSANAAVTCRLSAAATTCRHSANGAVTCRVTL